MFKGFLVWGLRLVGCGRAHGFRRAFGQGCRRQRFSRASGLRAIFQGLRLKS